MFPNTSFTASGPNESFLTENSCLPVTAFKSYDNATEKLVPCDPYVFGYLVFTVEVQPLTAEELAAIAKSKVPAQVSPRQIRQALTAANLRAQVEAAVSAGDQDLKDWWEFATQFERNHPMVIGMADGLGVTEQQLDDLFLLAGTL